jgi:hypothetical protein
MLKLHRVRRTILLTIAADTTDYNVFTAAGSPTDVVDVVVTINSGVTVGATAGVGPALKTTALFAAGSTVKIVNNGSIFGYGGNAAPARTARAAARLARASTAATGSPAGTRSTRGSRS